MGEGDPQRPEDSGSPRSDGNTGTGRPCHNPECDNRLPEDAHGNRLHCGDRCKREAWASREADRIADEVREMVYERLKEAL
jgi:hypothetical protein